MDNIHPRIDDIKCPIWGFLGGAFVKNPPANAEDTRDSGSIPESGVSLGVGNGNPLSILTWSIPWTEEPGYHKCPI